MKKSFLLSNVHVKESIENIKVNWQKVKKGCNEEIEKLIKKNIRTIRNISKVNGVVNEDLFQSMLLVVLKTAIPQYDTDKNVKFNTYLYHVLKSRRNNYLTRNKDLLDKTLSLDYEYEDGSTLDVKGDIDIEENVYINDMIEHIKSTLTAKQEEVLDMYYFKGLTYKEIANKLGISYQAVGYRMQSIKKKVKRVV